MKLSKTCAHSSISITETSSVRALLFSTDSTAYFLRQLTIRSIPFLVPIILSLHTALGFCYEPVSLPVPLTLHGISYIRFLLCHTHDACTSTAFLQFFSLDPYLRKFVSPYSEHSNRSWFIDLRHIGHTTHLWVAFVNLMLRCLCADFTELLTKPPPVGVSRRAFRGVTPAFHSSDYQFAWFLKRNVFSTLNKSHLKSNRKVCNPAAKHNSIVSF